MDNSMIIKTAIALVLTASLAGGAVYFGTQDESADIGAVELSDHPHNNVEDMSDNELVEDAPMESSSEESSSAIDRLLGRSEQEELEPAAGPASKIEETSGLIEEEEIKDDMQETALIEDLEQTEQSSEPALEVVDAESEIRANNGTAFEENNFVELKDKSELVELVKKEILKIESPEMKDQAYFDLVLYAIENDMYSTAANGILSIEKQEYRDSARGEYALGLIEDGQVQEAFKALEQIETENLKDVLQLKAIQALIAPKNPKP